MKHILHFEYILVASLNKVAKLKLWHDKFSEIMYTCFYMSLELVFFESSSFFGKRYKWMHLECTYVSCNPICCSSHNCLLCMLIRERRPLTRFGFLGCAIWGDNGCKEAGFLLQPVMFKLWPDGPYSFLSQTTGQ